MPGEGQQSQEEETEIPSEVVDSIGGGGWTRTSDLRIMSPKEGSDSTQFQQDSSAGRGKPRQNPQTIRKQKRRCEQGEQTTSRAPASDLRKRH